MGRWAYSDRMTVEESKSISIAFLNKHNYFKGAKSGGLTWSRGGNKTGSVSFNVDTTNTGNKYIQFQYTQTNRTTKESNELDYIVRLVSTQCYFGGVRWWFICPLVVNGKHCGRRVGALYLGNGKYFGCRHCYNLTYESSKTHDKRIDYLINNPMILRSYLQSSNLSKRLLAIKAGTKHL